ncbi:MAG: hypothetical protein RQ715_07750 [Methylococcales bacterium]|nr:hypothetical protein [Methylococcales bacterium]
MLLSLALSGCVQPWQAFHTRAQRDGLTSLVVMGAPFQHRLYLSPAKADTTASRWHVYIDGDGSPWSRLAPNPDPTSRTPLILDLIAVDPQPAVLLGRPCYHGLPDAHCQPRYWTSHRYSEAVVHSMAVALKTWLKTVNPAAITLIGYSGGGVLAYLLAERIAAADRLMTLAANLDTVAWSQAHRQPLLTDSLNPAEQPLTRPVVQWHLAGGQDAVVPAEILHSFVRKMPDVHYQVFENADHRCCWVQIWAELMGQCVQLKRIPLNPPLPKGEADRAG